MSVNLLQRLNVRGSLLKTAEPSAVHPDLVIGSSPNEQTLLKPQPATTQACFGVIKLTFTAGGNAAGEGCKVASQSSSHAGLHVERCDQLVTINGHVLSAPFPGLPTKFCAQKRMGPGCSTSTCPASSQNPLAPELSALHTHSNGAFSKSLSCQQALTSLFKTQS